MATKDTGQKPTPEPLRENVKDNAWRTPGDQVRKHDQDVINTKPAPDPGRPDESKKK